MPTRTYSIAADKRRRAERSHYQTASFTQKEFTFLRHSQISNRNSSLRLEILTTDADELAASSPTTRTGPGEILKAAPSHLGSTRPALSIAAFHFMICLVGVGFYSFFPRKSL